MTRRPLIGIGCNLLEEKDGDTYYKLDRAYVRSVLQAGGTPVLMPFFGSGAEAKDFLQRVDGVLFTGGRDLRSARWSEKKHPEAKPLHPEREASDFLAIQEALRQDKPLLAICLGCQLLNVALGGSLHQHIYDLPGIKRHSDGARHPADIVGATRLCDIVGTSRPVVNSYHHQACRDVGKGLVVTARSPDGLIEGIEAPHRRFTVGVQWHPEAMPDDRRQQALFRALANESRR